MSCICSFPWAGMCVDCNERADRLAADYENGVCSSECTKECSANDHCDLVTNPYCECKSCRSHNLDELPPKEDNA